MKRFIGVAAAAVMMAMTAIPATTSAAEEGAYMGVGIGMFNIKYSEAGLSQSGNAVGGLLKGGYNFNENIAAELRVGTTGKTESTYPTGTLGSIAPFTVGLSNDWFISYLAKPQFKVSDNGNLFAVLGGTTGKYKIDISILGLSAAASKTITTFTYGAGYEHSLGGGSSIGIEYVVYGSNYKFAPSVKGSMSGLTIDYSMKF